MPTPKETYAILGKASLWRDAEQVHEILTDRSFSHAFAGDFAVCLHGYQRSTIDVDMLVRSGEAQTVREVLESAGWKWDANQKQLVSDSGAILQLLLSGDKAGVGSEIRLPDPGDADVVTELEGLPVLTLARLIETKLACGQGNARRMHKDFADVVELIAKHGLNSSFARKLHNSVQPVFRELLKNARGQ
jgi:hypothetical protein